MSSDPASEPCQEWLTIEPTLPETRVTEDVSLLHQDFRAALDQIRKLAHNPLKIVPNGSRTVTARDGKKIPIRIYSPPGHSYTSVSSTPSSPATATSPPPLTKEISAPAAGGATSRLGANAPQPPLVIYFHGGGWTLGDPDFGYNECLHLASNGALVVAADYRKAPEDAFPVPINDCWDAFEAILSPSSKLNLGFDRDRVYLAGASAGAHLCCTTTILDIMASDKSRLSSGTRIKGLLLQAPVTCHPKVFQDSGEYPASWLDHAGSPILGRASMDRFWRLFIHGNLTTAKDSPLTPVTTEASPVKAVPDLRQPLVSPLHCPENILKRFPKVHIGVYGMDPLKDEGREFAERLKKVGVEVQLDVYSGWPHVAFMFYPRAEGAKAMFADMDRAAKWMGLYSKR